MPRLQLSLLGGLSARLDSGEPLHVPPRKSGALLAYLALSAGSLHTRDALMARFWSDRSEMQARTSLRQTLSGLRRNLGAIDPPPLVTTGNTVMLTPDAVQTDVGEFETLCASDSPQDFERAVALYCGDLLSGISVRDPAFEDWLVTERERLRGLLMRTLTRLLEHRTSSGEMEKALQLGTRLLELDPLLESVHRDVMRLHVRMGRPELALRQYARCREILARELGVDPAPETEVLSKEVAAGRAETARPAPTADNRKLDVSTSQGPAAKASFTRPCVALLPFTNLSGDSGMDYLVDGVTEDIILRLAHYRWLDVISRHSSFAYADRQLDVRTIARELGAQYVVEGSVRRHGDSLRINAELIDGRDGRHLWAKHHDRKVSDLFAVQEEIATAIAGAIEPELAAEEERRSRARAPRSDDVRDFYHRGMWHLFRFETDDLEEAEKLFRRAIELDPEFAQAHARLAYVYIQKAWYGLHSERRGNLEKAVRVAARAVALDDRDALGHFSLGRALVMQGDTDTGIAELELVIQRIPSFAQGYFGLAQALCWTFRSEEALPLFDIAIRLSPHDPHLWTFYHMRGLALYQLGRLQEAEKDLSRSVRLPNVTHWPFATLASVLGNRGMLDRAATAVAELMRRKPEYDCAYAREDLVLLQHAPQWTKFTETYVDGLVKAGVPARVDERGSSQG
jgi:TolB-like protein/Flp pilus assembly protein TadD